MPFNVSGVFQRLFNWRNDRDAGIKILAERMDQELDGIADGLNDIVAGNVAWRGPMTGVLGTSGAPAYSFSDDPDTGFYRASAGVLGFAVDGTELVRISAADLVFDGETVWHTGNDGGGSGLNADMVDGLHASAFIRKDNVNNGHVDIRVNDADFAVSDTTDSMTNYIWRDHSASRLYLGTVNAIPTTRADLVTEAGQTYWHSGNDGPGSGLNADVLDGLGAGSFLRSDAADSWSGVLTGTGALSTTSYLEAGRGSGGVALTHNDGYGNANVAFNHRSGIPEQNGNAARIEANTDATTGASLHFEVKSNVISGVVVDLTPAFTIYEGYVYSHGDVRAGGQYYYGDGKEIVDFGDTYLRLNQNGDFTNGVYTPGDLRVDGSLKVDAHRGLKDVTGNYGTVQTVGSGIGGWEGYSIDGRAAFIHDGGTAYGLHDDVNNQWAVRAIMGAGTELRYNGSTKLWTTSSGIDVTGSVTTDYLTSSGLIDVSRDADEQIRLGYNVNRNPLLGFYNGTGIRGHIYAGTGDFRFRNNVTSDFLYLSNTNNINALKYFDSSTGNHNTVWHSGNDGPGTGLAADTVDNLHASSFIRSDADDLVTGHTEWQDSKEVRVGNSADGRFFHNGTDTFLESHTGHLFLKNRQHSNGAGVYIQDEDSSGVNHTCAIFEHDRAELFYDNVSKMKTDGSGVRLFGRIHMDGDCYIGNNGMGDSWAQFYDDNSNTWRYLGWDDSQNEFVFEENNGNMVGLGGVGVAQTWQTPSRSFNTTYQNTTGRPIAIAVAAGDRSPTQFQDSSNGTS
ncbi:MAG: hypothetical protein JJ979_05805, partial [Roseibium sp.]|nr:hypothetical protein [Roseibium sp.]